ncbi:MAG: ABC transporter substrate-binding protein [Oscillospiraceae bacterium]|nr:ABC transporter substrate-binding protein [Oscillospiraceae bacterium]
MKKLITIICVLAMILALTACGGSEAPSAPADNGAAGYVVGICQLVQHPALDAATQGFKDALVEKLGDDVSFIEQNASGDSATCATICNQLVSEEVDLILANATAALQAASAATNQIPILGTSITDYGTALGMDDFSGTSGTNISGTSDLAPLDGQAQMLNELFPDAKNIGLLYCSGEPNSKYQADVITPLLEGLGYNVSAYTFADSNDVANVTASACADCDVLYIPTDNTAASCTEAINNVALNEGTPIICGEEGICSGCGVATLSISYYDLGWATGEMAAEILVDGADVSSMEVRYAPKFEKKFNSANCDALGITPPAEYLAIG